MVRILAPFFPAPASRPSANQSGRDSLHFRGNASSNSRTQTVTTDTADTVELEHAQPHHSMEATEAAILEASKGLFRAIKAGNADEVQTHLATGGDPNMRDRLFYTALHRAVDLGNPNIVSWLLKKGADPNAKSPLFSAPPVHRDPNNPLGQKVLQLGGDPSTMSPVTQDTPLDRALHQHKPNVIPALILGGAKFTDAQRPGVHEALKQVYQNPNLTDCLEQAVHDLDVRKAGVLLSVGVSSEKLPKLYADLLDTSLDTAQPKQPENQDERSTRHGQHHNALRLMSLLTNYVRDYTPLAPAITAHKNTLFPVSSHTATAKL